MFSILLSMKSKILLSWMKILLEIYPQKRAFKRYTNLPVFSSFLFIRICNMVIITFPQNWVLSSKMKLPINIGSYSHVRSLKIKNISFHNCFKWQNHSSVRTMIASELLLIFYSNLRTIFSTLNAHLQ